MAAENLVEERYAATSEEERPEGLADEYDLSRERQDRFALRRYQKAVEAIDEKRMREEIAPVKTRKDEELVEADAGPRRDTTLAQLAKLKPAFKKGGSVTAGNSSSLNDGAAAVLAVSTPYARAPGLEPVARIRSMGVAGVPPRIIGIGPAPTTKKALERAGISLDEVGLGGGPRRAERGLRRAVAGGPLRVGVDPEDERLNPTNGGATALEHSIGCSGAHPHHARARDGASGSGGPGLATTCIGVGQGIARSSRRRPRKRGQEERWRTSVKRSARRTGRATRPTRGSPGKRSRASRTAALF